MPALEAPTNTLILDDDRIIFINSDTLPGTKAQITEARAKGDKPAGGAGVAYIGGPDNALIENVGNNPVERFNHVHLYQEDPYCAQLWYQKHLNASVAPALGVPNLDAWVAKLRGEGVRFLEQSY